MSSFQKRKPIGLPPGTIISIHSKQPITSTGIPSLDAIFGGGLPIGSILLVEEDKFNVYSKVVAKYFLAEGIFSQQKTLLVSLDDDPKEMYKKLPSPCEEFTAPEKFNQPTATTTDDLRIAWRYNNLRQIDSQETSNSIGHNFDLTKQIPSSLLEEHAGQVWDALHRKPSDTSDIFCNNSDYQSLLLKVNEFVEISRQHADGGDQSKAVPCCRVCLTSLGSPLWYSDNFEKYFLKFLTILKSILRSTFGVCLITIPMHLLELVNETLPSRVRNLVDYSIQLEAFAGSEKETNPIFKEYHGLLNIKKMNALNTLNVFTPETTDLAFKLRRKKFVIEKLHLPPELQENDEPNVPSMSCANPQKHLLEF